VVDRPSSLLGIRAAPLEMQRREAADASQGSGMPLELLDERATARDLSRNALAEQLLGEALRTDRHPLIRFRAGGSGRRRAALIGTRLHVHNVITTLRGEESSVERAAEYLGVDVRSVQAALAY
jgi:hypothetical protein